MNASKFKRMLKAAAAVERHLASGLDSVRALKVVLENELAAGQAIGIASAAPAKAKRVKAERVKAERPAKAVKADKTERSNDRLAKVKARKAAKMATLTSAKPTKQKKLKPAATTESTARPAKQKASRHEKIAPALVKRGAKQRPK